MIGHIRQVICFPLQILQILFSFAIIGYFCNTSTLHKGSHFPNTNHGGFLKNVSITYLCLGTHTGETRVAGFDILREFISCKSVEHLLQFIYAMAMKMIKVLVPNLEDYSRTTREEYNNNTLLNRVQGISRPRAIQGLGVYQDSSHFLFWALDPFLKGIMVC
jgi:hypothetical protein